MAFKKTTPYDLLTDFSNHWTKNADAMVNDFPLMNNDIWILAVFLLFNFFLRYIIDVTGTKKAIEQRTNGMRFIYHCFLGGLCGASWVIGCLITDWNKLWFHCQQFDTFSTYGFSGQVKMWMFYFAILGKMTEVVEYIWWKSKLGFAVSLMEMCVGIYGLKFDPTPALWVIASGYVTIGLYTHYWHGIEIARAETSENITQYRRKMTYFVMICGTVCAYVHGIYTLTTCDPNVFPLHYSIAPLIYPIFAWYVYPKILIDAFSYASSSNPASKKMK